ncbi:unnamed protein product [Trichogramma brassicae]|uniref:Uncharacterized protein n=1 Tax=Trichogramma brassicae TaxID=86971 RepID=A0A6H5IMR5_9HYME|nr:unnamed protein product [Trichogramma brassicae]
MSREAKLILSLLVVVSLNASTVTSILFFGSQSYQKASYVEVNCDHGPHDVENRTLCRVGGALETIYTQRECSFLLDTGPHGLRSDSLKVVRFDDYRVILSWRVPGIDVKTNWRLEVVDTKKCDRKKPTEIGWSPAKKIGWADIQPLSFVVNKNSFIVMVFSEEPNSPCWMPDSGFDVPRCAMDFDERGQLEGEPRVWFYQTKRDDDMILEPLDYDNPKSGYLLVDTDARPLSVMVHVSIVKPDGMLRRLENYQLNPTTSPYDHVAYSTANRLIGVCVGNLLGQQYQLICSQFDRRGKQTIKQLHKVPRRNQYSLVNIPEGGGMLLSSHSCRDPDNSCELVDSITISIIRIGKPGFFGSQYNKNELYPCNRRLYRGEARLFQRPNGRYCYTHVCIGYPRNLLAHTPLIYTDCLPAAFNAVISRHRRRRLRSDDDDDDDDDNNNNKKECLRTEEGIDLKCVYDYEVQPKGTVYFDPGSYQNQTWTIVFCGDLIHRDDGQTLCEVSRYRDDQEGSHLERTCEVWLYRKDLEPDSIEVRPLTEDKVVLWWLESHHGCAWQLRVLHYEDCTAYHTDWAGDDSYCVPIKIIAHGDDGFAAAVTSSRPGPCTIKWDSRENVPRCWMFFDDEARVVHRPEVWFYQAERDDNMILEPLERKNPHGTAHLLIETSERMNANNSIQAFVRATIVQRSGKLLELGSYELWDAHRKQPTNGIAYSTANDLIGICVRNESKSIVCEQFDGNGTRTMARKSVKRAQGFATLNLPRPGSMLMLHYVWYNDWVSVFIVSRIDADVDNDLGTTLTNSTLKCDGRFNRAAGQLFVHEVTGQYCYAKFCFRDSAKNTTDGNYRPEVVSICLPDALLETNATASIDHGHWSYYVLLYGACGFALVLVIFLFVYFFLKRCRTPTTNQPIETEMKLLSKSTGDLNEDDNVNDNGEDDGEDNGEDNEGYNEEQTTTV